MSLQLNSVHLTWFTMRVAPHAWTHAHTWIQVRCVKTTRWMAASVLQVGDVQAFKAFKFRAPSWFPLDSTTCECLCGQQGPCLMIFPQRDASLSPSASANTTKSTTLARFTDRTPRSGTSKVPFFLDCYHWFESSTPMWFFLLLFTYNDVVLSSTCSEGRWHCKSLQTPVTCAVEEGSHVTTFDGKTYNFHGDCYYTLARVQSKVLQQQPPSFELWTGRNGLTKLCPLRIF